MWWFRFGEVDNNQMGCIYQYLKPNIFYIELSLFLDKVVEICHNKIIVRSVSLEAHLKLKNFRCVLLRAFSDLKSSVKVLVKAMKAVDMVFCDLRRLCAQINIAIAAQSQNFFPGVSLP